jgi:glycosyltransferase involved in cell wall biosynthesis
MRRFRGKPFVFMTACEEDCDGRYGSKNGRLFGMLYRYGLRRADRILVQTRRDGELLRRTYGLESTVFPNLFPAKPPAQTPKDVFLWVGRCSALKRPDLYLDLAQALPEERFVMIAPEAAVEEDLLSEVQRRAKDLPNVEMHGEIPFSEIQPWFDRAKVLVCTSTVEGFPNTFLQAAQGRTPILSLCVDPDGILERDQWGLCAGGDWRVFLNSAKRLSADSACRERLGEAAYRGLIENHDLAKNVQRFERIVADLLG